MSAGPRAAEALIARKEEFARSLTAHLYRDDPTLLERHGERGREKCLQDMRYNLEHLAPAVALGEPRMFESYVHWLLDLLAAYRIPASDVERTLRVMRELVDRKLDPEAAAACTTILDAGLGAIALATS